jgi:hypothetical protein
MPFQASKNTCGKAPTSNSSFPSNSDIGCSSRDTGIPLFVSLGPNKSCNIESRETLSACPALFWLLLVVVSIPTVSLFAQRTSLVASTITLLKVAFSVNNWLIWGWAHNCCSERKILIHWAIKGRASLVMLVITRRLACFCHSWIHLLRTSNIGSKGLFKSYAVFITDNNLVCLLLLNK